MYYILFILNAITDNTMKGHEYLELSRVCDTTARPHRITSESD